MAIFIAVGITVLLTNNALKNEEKSETKQVVTEVGSKAVVAVINTDESIYINKVVFDFQNKKVNCSIIKNRNVFSRGVSKTLVEHYKDGGKNELILSLEDYLNEDFKYLELSIENLQNITDIFGGIVVNNNTARLMGLQVEDFIKDDETANSVIKGLISSYFSNENGKGIRNNFLSLLENCDTDLCYIDFYNHWDEINSMEGG